MCFNKHPQILAGEIFRLADFVLSEVNLSAYYKLSKHSTLWFTYCICPTFWDMELLHLSMEKVIVNNDQRKISDNNVRIKCVYSKVRRCRLLRWDIIDGLPSNWGFVMKLIKMAIWSCSDFERNPTRGSHSEVTVAHIALINSHHNLKYVNYKRSPRFLH